MLRYAYAHDLHRFPMLAQSMFQDRAKQFHNRLRWDVSVDERGREMDQYDALDPLYVIWQRPDGSHGGSMRFLPTTGRTMVNEHFRHVMDAEISSPLIWECSRFCLAPDAGSDVASALVLGAGELMEAFHLKHFVGVFDYRMERIYRRLHVCPEVVGRQGAGRDMVAVGLWEMQSKAWTPTLASLGISRATSRAWLEQSLAIQPMQEAALEAA